MEHSELELINSATGLIGEAKKRLDPDYRLKLKLASYQQSLGDEQCLEQGLEGAKRGLEVIEKYRPLEVARAKQVIVDVKKKLRRFKPKPVKEEKPEPEVKSEKTEGEHVFVDKSSSVNSGGDGMPVKPEKKSESEEEFVVKPKRKRSRRGGS